MKIVINAGHTKKGTGTGANGFINESKETRAVAYELMKLLSKTDHEIIPCVYDVSSNNLKEAVSLANSKKADLFISVHFNAGGGNGVEVYSWKGEETKKAKGIVNNIEALGFKNRGIKNGSNFYVIKKTKAEAMLVECCFVDSSKDIKLYKAVGADAVAKAIYNAIV